MARKERPMSQAEKERLAFLKKTRQVLKPFDIDPKPYSRWTVGIGQSTPFPSDEEGVEGVGGEEAPKEDEESAEPEATSAAILPPPELIYPITQSSKFGATDRYGLPTTRKDKYSDFYDQAASKQSTRVAAAQWIPTFDDDPDEQGNSTYSGFGDILIGFARPSRAQSSGYGALYYWMGQNETIWETFKKAESFGKQVDALGDSAGQLPPARIKVYTEEHSAHDAMDEGAEDAVTWIWTIGFTTNRDAAEFEALKAARKGEVAARAAERARTTKGKKSTE